MFDSDEIGQRGDAEPAQHRAQHRIDVVDGEDRPPLLPQFRPGLEQPIDILHRRPRILAVDDQAVLFEILGLSAACRAS